MKSFDEKKNAYEPARFRTRRVYVGNVAIGAGASVPVQSMTNAPTASVKKVVDQIKRLEDAGCQIIRAGVPDEKAARSLGRIRKAIKIPLVADIHFNYRLALIAASEGVDKLRLNPGNIKNPDHIAAVVESARARNIPIRIGVNSGSIPREIAEKLGAGPRALVESALGEIRLLEDLNFFDIVVSLKSSSPQDTITAYRMISQACAYPLHLGVTEAGILETGEIRSAVGIGTLLAEGIGDTFRVSLTDDPVKEIGVAKEIKKALGLE